MTSPWEPVTMSMNYKHYPMHSNSLQFGRTDACDMENSTIGAIQGDLHNVTKHIDEGHCTCTFVAT